MKTLIENLDEKIKYLEDITLTRFGDGELYAFKQVKKWLDESTPTEYVERSEGYDLPERMRALTEKTAKKVIDLQEKKIEKQEAEIQRLKELLAAEHEKNSFDKQANAVITAIDFERNRK